MGHVRCTEQPVAHVDERFGDLQRSQIRVYHPFHGVATRGKLSLLAGLIYPNVCYRQVGKRHHPRRRPQLGSNKLCIPLDNIVCNLHMIQNGQRSIRTAPMARFDKTIICWDPFDAAAAAAVQSAPSFLMGLVISTCLRSKKDDQSSLVTITTQDKSSPVKPKKLEVIPFPWSWGPGVEG